MATRKTTEMIHEGKYAAEVPVELILDEIGWSPGLTAKDVETLDKVRIALREGDVSGAAKYGRIFELTPL